MRFKSARLLLSLILGLWSTTAIGFEPDRQELERVFADTVRPFVKTYCVTCHGQDEPKGQLDLSTDTTLAAVVKSERRWANVLARLDAEEMPPEKATPRPTLEERRAVTGWIRAWRKDEGDRLAGDPGPVLARRLSNTEYDYTIRDLTGANIRPAREFPIDPTNESGFDNSGESLLMSPDFCYRIDPTEAGTAWRPVSDYSLASRLSYFLWSSMPDHELLTHAAAGDLHQPEILIAQTRRMLRDDRVRGLATEFGGNWLDFRSFEQHNSVDRERFPEFTNELRQAMFEEPIHFFVDVAHKDGSVLDFLQARYTFVNPILAKHYGMPSTGAGSKEWVRVDDAGRYGRGGLLPMSVFLTKNSPGLRTSPVKRGYWVTRRLLGEQIPPPPPDVPELPKDEKQLGDLTLRQLLAKHRESKSCAGCHERFDSIGLVFEGYGPTGERRDKDLGGRTIDTQATFPGGSVGTGLDGLGDYLRDHRQQAFVDNLCRKLLSYALGRSLRVSDDATLAEMRTALAAEEYRWGSLIETIVTSSQFRNQRGRDYE